MSPITEPPVLTDRQLQVVRLLDEGLTHEEIGAKLGISGRTAKHHCDVLRQKFGVARKRMIAPTARALGLI